MVFNWHYWPTLLYCRNQCFALSFLLACVQILDFLSFHHLFGPWAIIIGDLMKDLGRFLVVLAIFVFGFSMHIVALNQPFKTPSETRFNDLTRKTGYFPDGKFILIQLVQIHILFKKKIKMKNIKQNKKSDTEIPHFDQETKFLNQKIFNK